MRVKVIVGDDPLSKHMRHSADSKLMTHTTVNKLIKNTLDSKLSAYSILDPEVETQQ